MLSCVFTCLPVFLIIRVEAFGAQFESYASWQQGSDLSNAGESESYQFTIIFPVGIPKNPPCPFHLPPATRRPSSATWIRPVKPPRIVCIQDGVNGANAQPVVTWIPKGEGISGFSGGLNMFINGWLRYQSVVFLRVLFFFCDRGACKKTEQ